MISILKSEIAQIKANAMGDQKSIELYLIEKTKALQSENAALKAANAELAGDSWRRGDSDNRGSSGPSSDAVAPRSQISSSRHPLLPSFLPPLQNVDAFTSLLGEEIANTYAKVLKVSAADRSSSNLSPSRPPSPSDDAKSVDSDDASPTDSNNETEDRSSPQNPHQHHHHHHVVKPIPAPSPEKLEPNPSPTSRASLDRLQSCLRQNIDKYMNENLNTMNISRCVRELLSVHNIGQRLFAKYVLGLSQGTVSELLSKPKPWDKLTEKGRDSYRKMHAWAADESCIHQLKSLVPRKGMLLFQLQLIKTYLFSS